MKDLTYNAHLTDDRLPLPERLEYGNRAVTPLADGEPYRPPNCTPIGGDRPPEKREKYEAGTANAELLRLLVDAINQLDWVVWVKNKMATEMGSGSSLDPKPPVVESKPVGEEEERLAFSRRGEAVEKYRAERERLHTAGGSQHEVAGAALVDAAEADAEYRESRKPVSDRARAYAEHHGCSYENALFEVGADAPADLLPSSPV